jgi:hypothetical protein
MQDYLFTATLAIDFIAASISLWLAFYIFGKGFPSKIALRATVVFLCLFVFFFGAYDSLIHPAEGWAIIRAVVIIITLAAWYSLTLQLLTNIAVVRSRFYGRLLYTFGILAGILLLTVKNIFILNEENILEVGRMRLGLPYIVYGVFLTLAAAGNLYNLLSGTREGLKRRGRYFLAATIFASTGAIYGVLTLALTHPMPRLILDLMAFMSVILLGIAVARHQILIDRRIALYDVPISALTTLILSSVYAFFVWVWTHDSNLLIVVMVLAIITHSVRDLAHEFVEQVRLRNEYNFRRKLHNLEDTALDTKSLFYRLKVGLGLLCQILNASGGFIAMRQGEEFIVVASRQSNFSYNQQITAELVTCSDVSKPAHAQLSEIGWLAPSFEGQTQIAVIAIGKPKAKPEYSSNDLELLGEVADQVGTLISLNQIRTENRKDDLGRAEKISTADMELSTKKFVMSIAAEPDLEFIKIVEDGLRHLPDYIALGDSPLASRFRIQADSQVERGKLIYQILVESIEMLRPSGARPDEPLPRVWYNYVVLHDAYVERVSNYEIMARLYISQGTFHRTRRNALRGLARLLLEKGQVEV